MKKLWLSLSPAHVLYLERQHKKRLGSSTVTSLGGLVRLFLQGKTPKRKSLGLHGERIESYEPARARVLVELDRETLRALKRLPKADRGRLPLESAIEAQAGELGFSLFWHPHCDVWCDEKCPGRKISRPA